MVLTAVALVIASVPAYAWESGEAGQGVPGPGAMPTVCLPVTTGDLVIWNGSCFVDANVAPLSTPLSKANGGTGGATGLAAANNLSLAYANGLANDVSITGVIVETAAGACNIPANALGTVGDIDVYAEIDGTRATTSNFSIVERIAAGSGTGTGGTALISSTTTKGLYTVLRDVIRNVGGATNSQDMFGQIASAASGSGATPAILHGTAAIDTTAAAVIRLNITPGNSGDTIVLKHLRCVLTATAGN